MAARIQRIGNKFYDVGTPNKSFLQVAKDLKTVGVKNWYFMLEIKDYTLANVNPYAVDKNGNTTLTADQISRVITECCLNPWYYLREIARIPDPGGIGVPYKANRGNIAQAWCILHGLDSWLCLPRQQGKTQSALALEAWAYSFGTSNSTFIFINKDGDNAKENLRRLGDQIDLLPSYLRFKSILDDDGKIVKETRNATQMKHPVDKNKIIIKPKATSYDAALSIARGLTAPVLHFDEPEFTPHIGTIISNSASTYDTAAQRAVENNAFHARIFTCTPGDLDTDMGVEAQEILSKTLPWSESFYDMSPEKIMAYHIANETNRIIYIEYSYIQIGLTNKWLREISAKIGDPLVVRREILLQRLHGSSLSPYPQEDLEYISSTQRTPIDALYVNEYFKFDIYEELKKDCPYIVGIDCSTGTLGDNNAITILNPYTVMPAAEFECAYIGETAYEKLIMELVMKHIPRAILCIERNTVGDGIIDHLLHSPISRNLYYDRNKNLVAEKMSENEDPAVSMLKKHAEEKTFYGVYTTGVSRDQMFSILSRHVSEYKNNFITKNIIRDLNSLIRKSSGRVEAGPGFHDDSIMSYLIALYVYYHGNNLEIFGFVKGSDETIGERNRGLRYEDSKVLPEEIKESMKRSEEELKALDYEQILMKAINRAQRQSQELSDASLVDVEYINNSLNEAYISEDDDMDLSIFDSLNNF